MFVVSSTHLIPREELASLADAQAQWLQQQHDAGHFLSSGSNLERDTDAILAIGLSREFLDELMKQSPYARANAIRYDIVEVNQLP